MKWNQAREESEKMETDEGFKDSVFHKEKVKTPPDQLTDSEGDSNTFLPGGRIRKNNKEESLMETSENKTRKILNDKIGNFRRLRKK